MMRVKASMPSCRNVRHGGWYANRSMNDHIVLLLAGIGVLAMFCQWVAWRLNVPAIVFLLLGGLAVGPGIGWLDPDALFGDLLFPFISLSVAVILFEGSLGLRIHEIRGMGRVIRRMTRSAGRRVGKECVSTCSYRGSQYH